MNNDLLERYIYAIVRKLPRKIRADVESELRELIGDMLEARCGDVLPTEHDLRVVLTELGTPAEVAEKYLPDSDKVLIGLPYFSKYKFVLQIVFPCVIFGIMVGTIASLLSDPIANPWYAVFFMTIGSLASGLLISFAIVTIIFAIFQWQKVPLDSTVTGLDNLPPVPQKQSLLPKSDAITGIVFSVLFAVLFLAVPQIMGIWLAPFRYVPYFNIPFLHAHWYLIVLLAILGILTGSAELYEGRYTKRLAAWVSVSNLLSVVLYILLFASPAVVNPAFTPAFLVLVDADAAFPAVLIPNIRLIFLGLVLFGLVVDTATTLYRTYRNAD